MRFREIDLNLFQLFEVLNRRRSVSAASRELCVTPSAVSHGLARLRKLIGDHLFVPTSRGLLPTPRATELAPTIIEALRDLTAAMQRTGFVPTQSERVLVLATTDFGATTIVPKLAKRVAALAPNVRLEIVQADPRSAVRDIAASDVHVGLGRFGTLPDSLCRKTCLTDREVLVVREGHPATPDPRHSVPLSRYLYVLPEPGDAGLGKPGDSARDALNVVMAVPHVSDAMSIVAETDLATIVPLRTARSAARKSGLRWFNLASEKPVIVAELVWHERSSADAAVQWLIAQMFDARDEEASSDTLSKIAC